MQVTKNILSSLPTLFMLSPLTVLISKWEMDTQANLAELLPVGSGQKLEVVVNHILGLPMLPQSPFIVHYLIIDFASQLLKFPLIRG
jgi:hypothetical protein